MKLAVKNCCGLSLRTGSIIIGVLTIIGSLFMSVNLLIIHRAFSSGVSSLVTIIVSCFLLQGVAQEKPLHMLPWLCITFSAVMMFPSEAIMVVEYLPYRDTVKEVLIDFFAVVVVFGALFGVFLVVYSHFKELLMPENRQHNAGREDPLYTILV